jgi:magnesium-transporting ATPase (P-type)
MKEKQHGDNLEESGHIFAFMLIAFILLVIVIFVFLGIWFLFFPLKNTTETIAIDYSSSDISYRSWIGFLWLMWLFSVKFTWLKFVHKSLGKLTTIAPHKVDTVMLVIFYLFALPLVLIECLLLLRKSYVYTVKIVNKLKKYLM